MMLTMKPFFALSVLTVLGLTLTHVTGKPSRVSLPPSSKANKNPLFRMIRDDMTGEVPFDTDRISLQYKMKHHSRHLLMDTMERMQGMAPQHNDQEEGTMRRQRHLQEGGCGFLEFAVGNCTQEEYCQQLEDELIEDSDGSLDISYTCEGDILAGNSTTTVSVEVCFYFSSGQAGIYELELFDSTTDDCTLYTQVTKAEDGVVETSVSAEFTRDGATQGSFAIGTIAAPCDPNDPFGEQCNNCTGAALDGQACASCAACDFFSNSVFAYSCSNVSPDEPLFETTCDTDDDLTALFFERAESSCGYRDLIAGNCSGDEYCTTVRVLSDLSDFGIVTCEITGTVPTDFKASATFSEVCYYNSTGEDGPYDEDMFDPMQDYCYTESEGYYVTEGMLSGEDWTVTVTRPVQGMIVEVSKARECTEEDSYYDDFLLPGICTDCEDTELTVDGMECTSNCTTCPEDSLEAGTEYASCTNLNSNIVDSCDFTAHGIIGGAVEYMKSATVAPTSMNQTMSPVMAPTAMPTKMPTDTMMTEAPTDSPEESSGDPPTVNPTKSPTSSVSAVASMFPHGAAVLAFLWFVG